MTLQGRDHVNFENQKFDIEGIKGGNLPKPAGFNLKTVMDVIENVLRGSINRHAHLHFYHLPLPV